MLNLTEFQIRKRFHTFNKKIVAVYTVFYSQSNTKAHLQNDFFPENKLLPSQRQIGSSLLYDFNLLRLINLKIRIYLELNEQTI